jgi:hypothetical protein
MNGITPVQLVNSAGSGEMNGRNPVNALIQLEVAK